MRRVAMCSAAILCVVLVSTSALADDYLDAHGNLWRDNNDTLNFTWDEVNTVCFNDGVTPCVGMLGAVDFTGWVWATDEQVLELLEEVSGVDSSLYDNGGFFWDDFESEWAPLALSRLTPTELFASYSTVIGWASTPPDPPATTAVVRPLIRDCHVDSCQDGIGNGFTNPDIRGDTNGVWLFMPGDQPPDEPEILVTDLMEAISELESAGTLPGYLADGMSSALAAVAERIDTNPARAISILGAFVRHVQAMVAIGILADAEGLALIQTAETLMDLLI